MPMIRLILALMIIIVSAGCSRAEVGQMFEEYLWQNRLVLVFAPRADDGRLLRQRAILAEAADGLSDRDIVNWELVYLDSVTVDGHQKAHLSTNPFYDEYNVGLKDFVFILIGKDGEVKLRKEEPVSAEELFATIDAMPMRQREMQEAE